MNNVFIQKSIVMGIGAMTEGDLDLSDSSRLRRDGKEIYYSLDDIHIKLLLKEGLRHVAEL